MITVLLVDDDEDCRLMMREAMQDGNFQHEIHEVECGEEALDFVFRRGKHQQAPTPGLIYLDIDMPGMDGAGFIRRFREGRSEGHPRCETEVNSSRTAGQAFGAVVPSAAREKAVFP